MSSSALPERIIPITILGGGGGDNNKTVVSNGHKKEQTSNNGASSSGGENSDKVSSRRQSLIVTHEDGTTQEMEGVVTKLGEKKEETRAERLLGSKIREKPIKIEEIGQDTLKREISERSGSNGKKEEALPSLSGTASKTEEKVRMVPIKLPDGRLLQRDPDETMEIKTEFTNYCHQEYPDAPKVKVKASPKTRHRSGSGRSNSGSPVKERIVPITLEGGEKFMPTFTSLDDIEPPEWSAFSPKNRQKNEGLKEKIVPIRMEELDNERVDLRGEEQKPKAKPSSMKRRDVITTSSSSREGSPIKASSRRTTTKQNREKMTKSHEKRVQHSVRFVDDEDEDDEDGVKSRNKKRSSSLDGRNSGRGSDSPSTRRQRERHRSGGPILTRGNSSPQEKTLHEIDRDINKIWRELQELEAMPSPSSRPPLHGIPRRGSPARGVTVSSAVATTPSATPVKIRTFTTAVPSSVNSGTNASSSSNRNSSSSVSSYTSPYKRSIFDPEVASSLHLSAKPPPVPTTTTVTATIPIPTAQQASRPPLSGSAPASSGFAYHPRRDMEPTRPGNITPAYSSQTPSRVITVVNNKEEEESMKRKGAMSMITAANGHSEKPRPSSANVALSPPPPSKPPATVLEQHAKAKVESNNNANGQVEFYPRFEMRPRAESLQKCEPILPPMTPTHVCVDKACQTEGEADITDDEEGGGEETKKSKKSGKCTLQ